MAAVKDNPQETDQNHPQVQQQQHTDLTWHIPQESLTSAIHQPSEEYIGKENIPQVQALDTSETRWEIIAIYKSCQQDQDAETLEPILPGID